MFTALTSLARLFHIARTLAEYDALFPLERLGVAPGLLVAARILARTLPRTAAKGDAEGRPGQRLAKAFETLGPSFIKLGQALSVRSDLVGEDIADDLSTLQDNLPPFPGEQARQTIEVELGGPVSDHFAHFEDTPVAAASIAQVHFAVTTNGDPVAVKVLRPGIEARFLRDIDLALWLARLVARTRPALRRLRPVEVVRTFEESVRTEMDLRLEASAAAELAENFEGDPNFKVPRIDWIRTAQRVLTLERIDGVRIDDVDALKVSGDDTGFEPQDILRHATEAFFNQVFRDGFFHADMHPGNMFVTHEGILRPVDFGIMGRLDRRTRYYLADMLTGFLNRDYRRVAEVHFEADYVPRHKSVDGFTQALRAIGEPILGRPLHEISLARLLAHLFQVTETFEMETQPQLLLLQKTMLVAEGIGRKVDPSVNMWLLAQPMIETWMRENRGPEARLRDAVDDTILRLENLPRLITRAETVVDALSSNISRNDGVGSPHSRHSSLRWVVPCLILVALIIILYSM
ncbi:MAG: 2-polyprenylphenol 6-hydroxylase [Alphaproteobacteria bacterium]|nr:2-polyprenylphenol 6-hydroxylase [Alphaproteobacteria bacterium]